MSDWKGIVSDADRAILEKGSWGRRAGFGRRPALIVVDAQNYMVGRPGDHDAYPLSCGDVGWEAVRAHRADRGGLPGQRGAGVLHPVRARQGRLGRRDVRPQDRRRARRERLLRGHPRGRDRGGDHAGAGRRRHRQEEAELLLRDARCRHTSTTGSVDTLIITGGSTANCVRATAVESSSFNYFTVLPREAVFDRIPHLARSFAVRPRPRLRRRGDDPPKCWTTSRACPDSERPERTVAAD